MDNNYTPPVADLFCYESNFMLSFSDNDQADVNELRLSEN